MHPSTPLAQVQADDAVIGLQALLFQVLEDPSLDSLIAPLPDRGR
jgi:hypothetical protein